MKPNKKIKTRQGKTKYFDVFLALIFMVAIVVALLFFIQPDQSDTFILEYDVVFEPVSRQISSNISPNKVFLSEDGRPMGTILSALNDRMVFYTIDKDKDSKTGYLEHVSQEYNTVYTKISADALFKDGSYYVGGVPIRAGEEITLRLPDFYGVGRITSVKVLKVVIMKGE